MRVRREMCRHYKPQRERCYDVSQGDVLTLKALSAISVLENDLLSTTPPEMIPLDVKDYCDTFRRRCMNEECKKPYFVREFIKKEVKRDPLKRGRFDYFRGYEDEWSDTEEDTMDEDSKPKPKSTPKTTKKEPEVLREIVVPWTGICSECHDSKRFQCETPECLEHNDRDQTPWMCMTCGAVNCSRSDRRHAWEHYKTTGHCISVALTGAYGRPRDHRFWCYKCECWQTLDFKEVDKLYKYKKGTYCVPLEAPTEKKKKKKKEAVAGVEGEQGQNVEEDAVEEDDDEDDEDDEDYEEEDEDDDMDGMNFQQFQVGQRVIIIDRDNCRVC